MDEKWANRTTRRYVNGATVRALREAVGISQAAFARDCLISPPYLCRIEQGEKQPTPQVVRRMAERLACSVDAITYVAERPQQPETAVSA